MRWIRELAQRFRRGRAAAVLATALVSLLGVPGAFPAEPVPPPAEPQPPGAAAAETPKAAVPAPPALPRRSGAPKPRKPAGERDAVSTPEPDEAPKTGLCDGS